MFGRWTEEEFTILRTLYHRVPASEIARRLGRTKRSIHGAAWERGLTRHRKPIDYSVLRPLIRRLNKQGFTDTEIAGQSGHDRHVVSAERKALGLPCQVWSGRRIEKVRAKTRAQCAAAGVANLGQYRALVLRVRAIRAGWPSDLRWRSVQILELLGERGPMTRRELAEAIGMPWRGSHTSMKSKDPGGTYLAALIRRGLVVRLGRVAKGKGRGSSVNLYSLALDAERRTS